MTWRWMRLKHLAAVPIVNGLGEAATLEDESWPRFVRTTDFATPRQLRDSTLATLPPEVAAKAPVHRGDILISAAGTVGKTYLHLADGPACFAGYLVRFRARADVDPRFVSYWTETPLFLDQVATGKVTSTIDNFSAGKYQNLSIRIPTFSQQRLIADFLDTETARIDALITKKRRMIELMRERFWHSVDTKFRAVDHVPRHKLTWLAHTWCDGPFGSSLTSAHYSDSGARVVRLGNVGRGEFVNLDAAFVPMEYFETLRRHEVLEGDLIVAGLGDEKRPLARACVAPALGPAMVKADCFRFRVRTELVSPDFVAWYLSSPSAVAGSAVLAQGSTRARANLATVCGLRVPLPHQSVQQLVVENIQRERSALSDVEARLKQQVNLLEEHRQALITAAVTGELEVAGVAA